MSKEKVTHMYPKPGSFDERIKARIAQVAAASEAFAQTSMSCPEKGSAGCKLDTNMGDICWWYLCPKGDAS